MKQYRRTPEEAAKEIVGVVGYHSRDWIVLLCGDFHDHHTKIEDAEIHARELRGIVAAAIRADREHEEQNNGI